MGVLDATNHITQIQAIMDDAEGNIISAVVQENVSELFVKPLYFLKQFTEFDVEKHDQTVSVCTRTANVRRRQRDNGKYKGYHYALDLFML